MIDFGTMSTIEFDRKNGDEEIALHNLNMLYNRADHQRFSVDSDGKLQEMTTCQKGWDSVCNFFWPCLNTGLQNVICKTLSSLTEKIKIIDKDKRGPNLLKACEKLFFEKMSRLSQRVFNRADIDKDNPIHRFDDVNAENKGIVSVLLESVKKTRKEVLDKDPRNVSEGEQIEGGLSKQVEEKEKKESKDDKEMKVKDSFPTQEVDRKSKSAMGEAVLKRQKDDYEERIMHVMLSTKLGLDLKKAEGGSSGVYVGTDLRDRNLLVIKPNDEGPFGINNPNRWQRTKSWLERNIFTCFSRESLYTNEEYLAEAGASIIDQFITKEFSDFNIIPRTRVEKFESKMFRGPPNLKDTSCKPWVDGIKPASSFVPNINLYWLGLGVWHYASKKVEVSTDEFQRFAILQFLIGDQDGHPDNWAIKGEGENARIVAFDPGLSCPLKHPTEFRALRNQHLWANLDNATEDFTANSKKIIEYICNNETKLYEKLNSNSILKPLQIKTLQQRIKVLNYYRDSSPKKLAEIKTSEDFDKILKSIGSGSTGSWEGEESIRKNGSLKKPLASPLPSI